MGEWGGSARKSGEPSLGKEGGHTGIRRKGGIAQQKKRVSADSSWFLRVVFCNSSAHI